MWPTRLTSRLTPAAVRRDRKPAASDGGGAAKSGPGAGCGNGSTRPGSAGGFRRTGPVLTAPAHALAAAAAIGALYLLAWLPWPVARRLGAATGAVFQRLLPGRRRVTAINLAWCFPDRSEGWRRRVQRDTFRSTGVMFAEIARAWCRAQSDALPPHRIEGLEHVLEAQRAGRPVLLVTGHFTCMDLTGRMIAERVPVAGVYRPLRNRWLEHWQNRCRARYVVAMISKRDPRGILRHLRGGGILWYAPDQDVGPARSRFVPFFDRPTATAVATWRLARQTGAAVVPMWPSREVDGSYTVRIDPALPGSEDDTPDRLLATFNAGIEAAVRQAPEQYFWLHRRFKTPPPGSRSPYVD